MTNTNQKSIQGQMLQVDAGKLAQGLKTTFEGVAMVFDCVGIDAGINVMDTSVINKAEKKTVCEEKKDAAEKTRHESGDAADHDTDIDDGTVSDSDVKKDNKTGAETAGEVPSEETAEQSEPQQEASSITQDDITKVIVQKIKKNRSNNEKIGQILKAYGVAKVGELPESKYEAFLTDLAEL